MCYSELDQELLCSAHTRSTASEAAVVLEVLAQHPAPARVWAVVPLTCAGLRLAQSHEHSRMEVARGTRRLQLLHFPERLFLLTPTHLLLCGDGPGCRLGSLLGISAGGTAPPSLLAAVDRASDGHLNQQGRLHSLLTMWIRNLLQGYMRSFSALCTEKQDNRMCRD